MGHYHQYLVIAPLYAKQFSNPLRTFHAASAGRGVTGMTCHAMPWPASREGRPRDGGGDQYTEYRGGHLAALV